MRKTLLILLCILVFCFSGCSREPVNEGWLPYYTGEEREWDFEHPWDWNFIDPSIIEQHPEFKREFDQSQGMEAWENLGKCSEPDYAGSYVNDSGTLTVLITNPTIERAKHYGELCKVGVWVVEAEYTDAELNSALDETAEKIEQWIANNPNVSIRLDGWGISSYQNRAVFHLSGNDSELMKSQLELPGCVALEFSETADSSDTAEIPWEPNYRWNSESINVYLDQAKFPVGVKNINITLENRSDGYLSYGQSYTFEKYVDGEWVNASGNLAFTAVGHSLEEYDKETFFINTEYFPEPLGVGLYRIIGSELRYCEIGNDTSYGQDYEGLGNYVLEFAVTEDAEPAPDPLDTIYGTAGALPEKEDWQWYSRYELTSALSGEIQPTRDIRLEGPYFVRIAAENINTSDECFDLYIFDRSTGSMLTEDGLHFDAHVDNDILTDRDGNLFIRAADNTYCISVTNGMVDIMPYVQFPDIDIPYPPESSDTALDGDLSIQMEQQYYSTDDDSIAVLITNNTEEEMTIEYKRSDYGIYKLEATHSWFYNCWYNDPDALTPEEQLFMEPNTLTIATGETYRFEESLEHWSYDNGNGEKPLGRGLYRMIFSQITVNDQKASFTVEFGINNTIISNAHKVG